MSSEEEEEQEEYVVEAIRAWRYHIGMKEKQFLIKWKNFSESENTWEPSENLTNCPKILDAFINNLRGKDLIHFNAPNMDKLNGFSRNAEFKECVGVDGPHESDEENSPKEDKQHFYHLCIFGDQPDNMILAEECTTRELMDNQPDEAWKFYEERLLVVRKPTQRNH